MYSTVVCLDENPMGLRFTNEKCARYLGKLYALLGVALTLSVQAQDACNALLIHGIYDEIAASSSDVAQHRVYDYVCTESRINDVMDRVRTFEVGFKAFSLGATLGATTTKGYYDAHCRQSKEELFRDSADHIYVRKINESALRSWNDCISSSAQGVRIVPDIAPDEARVRFELKRTEGDDHFLKGVDSRIFSCSTGADVIDGQGLDGAPIELGGDAFNFVCTREGNRVDSLATTHYPSGDLVLNLSTGQFVIDFRERVVGSLWDRLTALNARIETIDDESAARLQKLEDRMSVALVRHDDWPKDAVIEGYGSGSHRWTVKRVDCPDGTYVGGIEVVYRGTCMNHCNPDGGIVGEIRLVCKPF